MELVVAEVFNLFVVEAEVGEGTDLVALVPAADVPNRQLSIVAACNYLALLVGVPLK